MFQNITEPFLYYTVLRESTVLCTPSVPVPVQYNGKNDDLYLMHWQKL